MQVKLLRRAAGRLDSVVLHGSLRSTELGCRPLKGHRARMRELYAAEDRRRKRVRIERNNVKRLVVFRLRGVNRIMLQPV